MKKILVTGANGQLARCIKDAVAKSDDHYYFADRTILDISNTAQMSSFFNDNSFDYCINTAAYTNVEKAEEEKNKAFAINETGVKNLAQLCVEKDIVLLHISTDYVFDGLKQTPYIETDQTKPINVYGASKLAGEKAIQAICKRYFIIRTSWLYSQYGHNFYKAVVRNARQNKPMTITTEQTGTPTNANNLATTLITIISSTNKSYGLYHFSNKGKATWYDFAAEILKNYSEFSEVILAKTDHYPTFAKRPTFSVMNCDAIEKKITGTIQDWKTSLKVLINRK